MDLLVCSEALAATLAELIDNRFDLVLHQLITKYNLVDLEVNRIQYIGLLLKKLLLSIDAITFFHILGQIGCSHFLIFSSDEQAGCSQQVVFL